MAVTMAPRLRDWMVWQVPPSNGKSANTWQIARTQCSTGHALAGFLSMGSREEIGMRTVLVEGLQHEWSVVNFVH